jgi:hypothetical protein
VSNKNYNFDEVNDESPTIILGGENYKLVYPTLEEIEKIQALKTDEERTDAVYQFIHKTDEKQPEFRDVLKKQSIKVLIAFTEMIKTEFGVE